MDIKTQKIIDRLKNENKVKILFVCLGNICRSPAAEGMMKAIVDEAGDSNRWDIDSAGTGGYHIGDLPDRRMRIHAMRRNIELNHICRQVRQSDFRNFDLIIGMDDSNISNLKALAPDTEAEQKIVGMAEFFRNYTTWDYVPDPYYEGAEGFELVLDLLDDGCRNLYEIISNRNSTK